MDKEQNAAKQRRCKGDEPVRVIAGSARGRRIATLQGEDTRPTLERVKEGMFSAVQFWLPGARVLDLFAGSGQLGLEALSRGAVHCTFVEQNPAAAKVVQQNIESTGFAASARVVKTGAESFLAMCRERFDLVLLDPPYKADVLPGLLGKVAGVCAQRAEVLCESAPGVDFPAEVAGLVLKKQYRYGTVMVTRYQYTEDT